MSFRYTRNSDQGSTEYVHISSVLHLYSTCVLSSGRSDGVSTTLRARQTVPSIDLVLTRPCAMQWSSPLGLHARMWRPCAEFWTPGPPARDATSRCNTVPCSMLFNDLPKDNVVGVQHHERVLDHLRGQPHCLTLHPADAHMRCSRKQTARRAPGAR